MELEFAAHAEPGHRLRSVKVNGKPMKDDQHYTFAGCERDGEQLDMVCRLGGVHEVKVLKLSVHEAMRAYLVKHPVIAPKQEGRAVAVDLPQRVFSQDALLRQGGKP
jgi:hypothetical protein